MVRRKTRSYFKRRRRYTAALVKRRYFYPTVPREKNERVPDEEYVRLDPENNSRWYHQAGVDDYGRLSLKWLTPTGVVRVRDFTRVETANLFEVLFEARNDGLNKFGWHDSADDE